MDDLDSSSFDADTKGFSLIDVSVSDDDFLFSSSSTSEANAVDNQGGSFVEEPQAGKPSNLLAAQRPKKHGKCNMRKSLAWDSAFFTSAGVLDAEELSSIMEGAETGLNSNRQLPGIQEELSKSTDSIATFESDSLTLESIEADLFSDIRASIQRSSKTSNSGNENGGDSANGCSKKIGQPPPGNMVKPKLATRKPIPAVPGPGRVLKSTTSVSKQVTKPVVRGRELNSTLPRSSAQTTKASLEGTAASKRMSVNASSAKSEMNHAGNINGTGKETLISKGPHPVDSRKTLQKPMAPSKLSSASSVLNKTAVRSSQSFYDSSSSSSTAATKTTKHRSQKDLGSASNTSLSESVRKSLSDVARRKIAKSANLPPGTKSRIPSRLPVKSKPRPGESQLSDYVKSTSELSSSISPASSVSEWSMDSSSSTATVTQKNSGLKHGSTAGVSPVSKLSQNMQKRSNDISVDRHDLQVASVVSQSAKQSPKGAVVPRPGSAKPSGLRLPSPKIGFFDGAKASPKIPSDSAQSRIAVASKLPRSALGNHSPGPVNKAKPGGDAVKSSTSAAKTSKLYPQKIQSSPKLTKLHERFDQSVELPSDNVSDTCSEVTNTSINYSTLQSNSIIAQTPNEGEYVVEPEPNNHSTSLQKDSVSMSITSFDPSSELSKSTSTTSALEGNTPVSEEVGSKQLGRSSPEIRSDDKVDPNKSQTTPRLTEQLHDYSVDVPSGNDCDPLPTSDRDNNITEEADVGKHVADSGSKPETQSTGCQKDLAFVIVNDDSDFCIELPNSTSATPALEQISEVSEETDKGEHFDEASIIAKDLLEVILNASNSESLDDDLETNSKPHKCPDDEASIIAKDLLEVILNASNAQSLDDELETNSEQHKCPDDDNSALNDNFMVSEQEPSEESNVTVPEAVDGGKHVADLGSDTMNHSIEAAKPTSPSSALDKNTQASDEGQHFAEASLITKDQIPTVPIFDDVTSSEPVRCSSSEIERNTIAAEVKDRGEYQDDLGSACMDDILVFKRDANKETKSISTDSDAKDHFAGMQKDPVCMIVNDDSNTSDELPETSSTNSVVERNTQVFEEALVGKQAEVSFTAHNHSEVVLETSNGSNSVDEIKTASKVFRCSSPEIRNSEDAEIKDGKEHPDDNDSDCKDEIIVLKKEATINTVATGSDAEKDTTVLQKDPISIIDNDGLDTSIELPESTSTNSASERNTHVSEESDGGKHFPEVHLTASNISNLNDGPETSSETITCFSSETGRDTKTPEVEDKDYNVILSEKEASEEINITVAKGTDEGEHVVDAGSNAMNNSTGLQNDQIFFDGDDSSVILPNFTSTDSALERTTEISEETDSVKHFDEVAEVVQSSVPNVHDEVKSNSERLVRSSPEIRRDREVTDAKDVKEGSISSIELPESSSTNSC